MLRLGLELLFMVGLVPELLPVLGPPLVLEPVPEPAPAPPCQRGPAVQPGPAPCTPQAASPPVSGGKSHRQFPEPHVPPGAGCRPVVPTLPGGPRDVQGGG